MRKGSGVPATDLPIYDQFPVKGSYNIPFTSHLWASVPSIYQDTLKKEYVVDP